MICVHRRAFLKALFPAGLAAVLLLAFAAPGQARQDRPAPDTAGGGPANTVADEQRAEVEGIPAERIARIEQGLRPTTQVRGRSYEPATIQQRMAELKIPAVSIAVVNDGRIEWARAWGTADLETGRPATTQTLFQAASISKPVAATAALRLVEQGKLALDEPVNARLASWKLPENELTTQTPVTLRHLLTHTGGTTVHGFPGYEPGKPVPTLQQILDGQDPANTAAVRVDLVPGTQWRYSGGGFTILQQLMSDVTGEPFDVLMQRLVLEPAGMAHSTYAQPLPADLGDRAATAYDAKGIAIAGRCHTYPEQAAAGLWTTPSDLARWILAIQRASEGGGDPLLSQATINEMLTPGQRSFGLGVQLEGEDIAERRFSHGGSNKGFRCYAAGYVEGGRGVVVMINSDVGTTLGTELVQAVAREYGWPGFEPREIVPVAIEPAKLKEYAGTFSVPGTPLQVGVEVEGERIDIIMPGGERRELIPTGDDTFVTAVGGVAVRFGRDAEGKVQTLLASGQTAQRVSDQQRPPTGK